MQVVYVLRCALQDGDMVGVARALGLVEDKKIIVPLILDEIANAKAEVQHIHYIICIY